MSEIAITVKLFAAYQEAYQASELSLQFPSQCPVSEVLERFITEHPELERWRHLTRFGIDYQFVEADTLLQDGDEVVLIPPTSGG